MKHERHPILTDIEAFLAESGMSESYFGRRAATNTELVKRLRDGGGLHFATEAKIRAFIDANSADLTENAAHCR